MNERRAFLKQLATRSADLWARAVQFGTFQGESKIVTRNTIYQLRDGVCVGVTRRDGDFRSDPGVFVGMRMIGWLAYDDPRAGLMQSWRPGAYAVLWRPRAANEEHASVALTSASLAYETIPREPLPIRRSAPPPLPARAAMRPQPPLPSQIPTMTRVFVPAAPETPTSPARRSTPPPLPPRARLAANA